MFLGVKKFSENFSRPRSGKNLSSENWRACPDYAEGVNAFILSCQKRLHLVRVESFTYFPFLARNREFRDALGEYFSEIANGKKVILFFPQYTKQALISVLSGKGVGYSVMTYDAKIDAFVVK